MVIVYHKLYQFNYNYRNYGRISRLVVVTILKNISQWEGLSHILWKNMFETSNQMIIVIHENPTFIDIYQIFIDIYRWSFYT